jgi:hypothetical protein
MPKPTLADFEKAVAAHDLTYMYSDDPRWYHAGVSEMAAIQSMMKQLPRDECVKIWNKWVDEKLVADAATSFHWK